MSGEISEEGKSKENSARETDLNCQFLPIRVLENIIERVTKNENRKNRYKCSRSLIQLQSNALNYRKSIRSHMTWSIRYNQAITRAVQGQNWDKLLRLLKIAPMWEHYYQCGKFHNLDTYLKALLLLLMYHPSAKSQSLMDEFFHMVLSLRSDEDKRAFIKVLTSVPNKLFIRNGVRKHGEIIMD